jgi:hypothetical protein
MEKMVVVVVAGTVAVEAVTAVEVEVGAVSGDSTHAAAIEAITAVQIVARPALIDLIVRHAAVSG